MNTQLLIDAIMRQTTVLIAQLATAGGVRAPLSHIANQVFVDLSRELREQGISRKVSADMFGMALRAYIRKLQRLSESSTDRGNSLWQAVLDFVADRPVVSRAEVLLRFNRDEPVSVRGILHDLTESGLLFSSGSGDSTVYRALGEDEARYARLQDVRGRDELLSVLIYREGPFTFSELLQRSGLSEVELKASLERLCGSGQVERGGGGELRGTKFFIPLDAGQGWEGAVLDHYHALVRTICARLLPSDRQPDATCGGATYTFEVWAGHPLEAEVLGTLGRLRQELSELRQRLETHNDAAGIPAAHLRVVCYAGQHVTEQHAAESGATEQGLTGLGLTGQRSTEPQVVEQDEGSLSVDEEHDDEDS